jgi:RND family efflux transporter MFP subunit
LIFLAVAGAIVVASRDVLLPAAPVHVVPVLLRAATSQQAAGSARVRAAGWLEPDPFPIYVHALTPGVVERVEVLEGDEVKEGDVVVQLISEDNEIAFAAATAEHDREQSSLKARRADLEAAEEVLETLVDRQAAAQTATAREEGARAELARWPSRRDAAQAALNAQVRELVRKRPLVESRAVSALEVEVLEAQVAALRAGLEAMLGERPGLEARVAEAVAARAAAVKHLELLIEERRDVALAHAALAEAEARVARAAARKAEAQLALDRTQVRAPRAGVVLRRLVAPGSRLGSGDLHSFHALHLYDRGELQARVDVPLADIALIGVDQPAEIVVEALPERTFHGRVSRLVQEADVQKNTVEVKVTLLDSALELKPEMLCRVRFLEQRSEANPAEESVSTRQHAYVPRSLLGELAGERAHVWVAGPVRRDRALASRREVTLGLGRAGEWWEVTSGLQSGDLLIADPPAELGEGDRVRVIGEAQGFDRGGS